MEETGKILIVDDNDDNRELVIKVLRNKGYETVEAVDGDEALDKAKTERPDLILMDISLPKMDGYEVTRRLRLENDFRDIPIIALTAHAMTGDREKAICAGCDGYIAKPVNIRELPGQIQYHIREKRKGRQLEQEL